MRSPTLKNLVLALATFSCIGLASANIKFNPLLLGQEKIYNPGEAINVTWTIDNSDNTTAPDMNGIQLELRALTGQKYVLASNVSQTLLNFPSKIPINATGGLHSLYCNYASNRKMEASRQFNISGPIVNLTTSTGGDPTSGNPTSGGASTGISGAALAGIIAGAVVVLLSIALIFFCRHRRRVANSQTSPRSMDENKEAGFVSGPGAYNSKKNQDKESLTKDAGSAGGPVDGMVNVPINGGPGQRRMEENQRPRQQQQQQQPNQQQNQQQQNQQQSPSSPGARNPFDGPGTSPRQNPNQQFQYQPPQPYNGSMNPSQQQQQRNMSPFQTPDTRHSFESELESAYDPKRPSRMMTSTSPAMNNRSPSNGSGLAHSPSAGNRYPRNMTPQPNQNPFGQEDHESVAMAAAVAAAAASPIQAHRHLQQQQGQQRTPASPRMKEIEMQQLDIQQHHQEQQQKMLQRQQQQQSESKSSPTPVAQISMNPTQFDDKAEYEEDANTGVYNGYRDTIFGAYAPQQGDEDEDDEDESVPSVPALNGANSGQNEVIQGANVIQRKKSVKFTGVPQTGPIVLPSHEAAKEHQAQRQQRQQQQQQQQDHGHDNSGSDSESGEDLEDDEDDIKLRLMQTEAQSPSSISSRPYVNTNNSSPAINNLSPIQSPEQSSPYYNSPYAQNQNAYVSPSPTAQRPFKPSPLVNDSPSLNPVGGILGDGFYEDVLAAVEKSSPAPSPASVQPTSSQADSPTTYKRPVLPPVPAPAEILPLQSVQQQYIPAPQPQQLQPVDQEVFGAPSPRIAPATLAAHKQQFPPVPSPRSPARTADQQRQNQLHDDEVYDPSLL